MLKTFVEWLIWVEFENKFHRDMDEYYSKRMVATIRHIDENGNVLRDEFIITAT